LVVALPPALPVALALTPAFGLTLADARAAICLLASLLASGAFFVGLWRPTVSGAVAIGSALGQCGARG